MSRAIRLGIFIVGALTILAIGTFLIGDRQMLFASTYRLESTFPTVAGLGEGAEVHVGGIRKGVVKWIQLPPTTGGQVVVGMKIQRSAAELLRTDSVAAIDTEGLLGNKYVDISFGSPNAPPVHDGSRIAGVRPLDMSDLMNHAEAVLTNVEEGTAQFTEIGKKINGGTGTIGALVNDKRMYVRLEDATQQAKKATTAFHENMQALKRNFFLRGFFNNRGYEDSTRLTLHEIRRLPDRPARQSFRYEASDVFADAKLKRGRVLDEAGRFLEAHPFRLAVVTAAGSTQNETGATVTLVGCLVSERDYRQAHNLGGGAMAGMGLGDEFVLVDSATAPASGSAAAAGTCSERGTGPAYRVTGDREEQLKGLIGRRVEITGAFKREDPSSKLPREVVMSSYREAAAMAEAAPAPEPMAAPAQPADNVAAAPPAGAREELPRTASTDLMVAVIGLLFLTAASLVWLVPRREL